MSDLFIIDESSLRRMPVYLLLECGDSMSGEPIVAVAQGVQLLANELANDPASEELVWLSVIAYSTYAQQLVPLTPMSSFTPPSLSGGGVNNLGNALRVLGDSIRREIVKQTGEHKGDYEALVFWLTASEPMDNWQDGLRYLQEKANGLFRIIAMGAGSKVNVDVLRTITPDVLSLDGISSDTLKQIFQWTSQSAQPSRENK